MPTANHSINTRGGPDASIPTSIFKKCDGKTSSVGQEPYILIIR